MSTVKKTRDLSVLRRDVQRNGPAFVLAQVQAAARALLANPGVQPAAVEAAVEHLLAEVFDGNPR